MKTDYNKLNGFEACAILIAALGVALIGFELFSAIPNTTQAKLVSAFRIFDMHEDFYDVQNNAVFVVSTVGKYYNEFDIAFAQTLSFPDQIGTPLIKFADSFADYAQSVAEDYRQNNLLLVEKSNAGKVLGEIIVKNPAESTTAPEGLNQPRPMNVYSSKQYYYHAPAIIEKTLFK